MPRLAGLVDAVVGIGTHRDTHQAEIANPAGAPIAILSITNDEAGFAGLLAWISQHAPGPRLVVAVEGTRSYGIGVARALAAAGFTVRRMRFAYSPLAELTESLHLLGRGPVPEQYRGWFETIRSSLGRVDMPLLRAVVPPGDQVPSFMFMGAVDAGTTIERQLQLIAEYPAERLRHDLSVLWDGTGLPAPAQRLVADGPARLVDVLWEYWQVAIGPQWPRIRALLDADVAYRAGRLASGGIESLLADLHPRVKLHDRAIQVGTHGPVTEHDLSRCVGHLCSAGRPTDSRRN
jgi:Transposase